MLELINVCKTFNPGTVNAKTALNDLNLTLNDGDFVTVIGGNGAGKSTMLNAIAGSFQIDSGKIVIDGIEVADSVSATGTFTPDTWSGKQLGDYSNSTRWLGYNITVSLSEHRSTPWIKDMIKKYQATHKTPELTIQGIMNDPDSDFFDKFQNDVCTFVGCVPTGAMPLTALDSGGDVVTDNLTFNARDFL